MKTRETRTDYLAFAAIILLLVLFGCSGGTGGTGGTGSISDPVTVSITGQANKGPFVSGAAVSVAELDASGNTTRTRTFATTASGRYTLAVSEDAVIMISVTGRYYSELEGEFTSQTMTIRGIHDTRAGTSANVNLMTHLIHERVLDLMESGTAATAAIAQAEGELTDAFGAVLAAPAGDPRFSDLLVINALDDSPETAGNGYLLALTSLLEQKAAIAAEESGNSTSLELGQTVADLVADFGQDGDLQLDVEALREAEQRLDPNRVHENLFRVDASFKSDLLAALGATQSADEVTCVVRQERFACFENAGGSAAGRNSDPVGTLPLEELVADMNRYLDTDGDGVVNRFDDDDDGDDIADDTDSRPFDPALLVRARTTADVVAYLKRGLTLWSTAEGTQRAAASAANDTTEVATPEVDVLSFADAFTETNVLVQGVDEIDHVKYDGEHLFLANRQHVQVIRATEATQPGEIVSSVRIDSAGEAGSIRGMYLTDPGASQRLLTTISNEDRVYWLDTWFAPHNWQGETYVDILDASNVESLVVTDSFVIDGDYVNSRRIGDTLYLVTRFTPDLPELVYGASDEAQIAANAELIAATQASDLLPSIHRDDGTTALLLDDSDCLLPPLYTDDGVNAFYPTTTTITAIDLTGQEDPSSVCMVDGIHGLHVSRTAIYLASFDRGTSNDSNHTLIHKFALADDISYRGTGKVAGWFWGDPTFLMGEHDDRLTAVTTRWSEAGGMEHLLTVLGESEAGNRLETLGHIPNAGDPTPIGKPGEQIYATRIIGDRAYIVTFEKVDPVYVIDLADAEAPRILGELEIPGFSSYLHPIGDDLLLGVGKNTSEEDGITWFQGLNVRLFDVSDPEQPTAAADLSYGLRGSSTPVLWDPHAFTILSDEASGNHRIAIPMSVHGEHLPDDPERAANEWQPWTRSALALFEVSEDAKTLEPAGWIPGESLDTGIVQAPNCCDFSDRSFMNEDTVHFVYRNNLITANWATPETTGRLFIPTMFADGPAEACTADLRNGLAVQAIDRETGEWLSCPTVTAEEGDFTATNDGICSNPFSPFELLERPGTYAVTVAKDGYDTWTGDDVVIQADQCHVGQTNLEVYLSPL